MAPRGRGKAKAQPVEIRPVDYPPPFRSSEAIAGFTDPADERIEVGVLIVGAGPAGLACAIRLGQLLEERPDVAEQLGEVPIAIVDKGKAPGSHLLSGAVMNPRSIRRLFQGRLGIEDVPNYGAVHGESVYFMTRKLAIPIPPPPVMKNHGNVVVSMSQLGRFLAEQAEEAGAMILPETAADRLIVTGEAVRGIRTGDKGRGREGQELGNFEPGNDIEARVTVLSEGTQGYLTGSAIDRFGLGSPHPQQWELGVKEVWKVAKPLGGIVHTMGWPLRPQAKYREFGGSWLYPMGPDLVSLGFVIGLDYRDVDISAHDLLQEFKTHPKIRGILEGGERLAWGAKTIPSGGYLAMPTRLYAPGMVICGDGAGMVNIPRLKGIHYAIESGRLAAEAIVASFDRGQGPRKALASYDAAVRSGFIGKDLHEVRNIRQVFSKGMFVGGALASAMIGSKGNFPRRDVPTHADAEQPLLRTNRAASYPVPDGKLTFDKLSSVFASGNRTRDDQPNHIRIQETVPRDVAEMWVRLCPAQVYEIGADCGNGTVEVLMAPSNCVQCGAITAKGGRLTPPEGGSGPEYQLT